MLHENLICILIKDGYNEDMNNEKLRQEKIKTLKQLSQYREQMLKTKISKAQAKEYANEYRKVCAAIKVLSDDLFGRIIHANS